MITGRAAGRTPRRPGRAARLSAVVLATASAALLGTATPARAHGGPISLEVSGNGADRVLTTVTWKKDGHPVSDPVDLTFVAAPASGGPGIGPIRMMSSAEGQSFYVAQRALPKGAWKVTMTATAPAKASVTKTVTMYGPVPRSMARRHPGVKAGTDGGGAAFAVPVAVLIAGLVATAAVLMTRRRRHE